MLVRQNLLQSQKLTPRGIPVERVEKRFPGSFDVFVLYVTDSGSEMWRQIPMSWGFHTLNLARSFDLSRKGKVPAIVLPQEMPGSERRAITLVDLLVKSAIDSHAWLEPRVLAISWECCREIDEKLLVRLVPGAASRRGLARLRGVSYRTIFPRLVKNGESEVSQ